MIEFERFSKNINTAHLAYITGNEDIVLKVIKGLLAFFPNSKEDIEHFMFYTNFGLLEGFEMTIEELYNQLIDNYDG